MGVLYARVGGAWVPVGGAQDEVWVAAAAPTDPGVELWFDTDAPGATPSEAQPRGALGRTVATASAFSTASTTFVDFTVTAGQSPSVSLTLDAARLYRATFRSYGGLTAVGSTERVLFGLVVSGVLVKQVNLALAGAASTNQTSFAVFIFQPAASGLQVVKVQVAVSVATTSYTTQLLTATNTIELLVEDIGLA